MLFLSWKQFVLSGCFTFSPSRVTLLRPGSWAQTSSSRHSSRPCFWEETFQGGVTDSALNWSRTRPLCETLFLDQTVPTQLWSWFSILFIFIFLRHISFPYLNKSSHAQTLPKVVWLSWHTLSFMFKILQKYPSYFYCTDNAFPFFCER